MGRINSISGYVDRNRFTKEIFLNNTTNITQQNNSGGEQSNQVKSIKYVVKRGDTLSEIALKYKTTVKDLVKINNIKNRNLIYIGQKIIINVSSINNANKTNKDITHKCGHIIYKIKYGDTLSQIAKEYGTTVQSIVQLSNIKNKNLIYAGEEIRIQNK